MTWARAQFPGSRREPVAGLGLPDLNGNRSGVGFERSRTEECENSVLQWSYNINRCIPNNCIVLTHVEMQLAQVLGFACKYYPSAKSMSESGLVINPTAMLGEVTITKAERRISAIISSSIFLSCSFLSTRRGL